MSILRSKFSGWTWNMERHFNGPGGSWNPANIISDAVSSVGDALADIDPGPAIGQAGAEVDNFVNREIPGGWVTVGAAALTGGALAAESGFFGTTTPFTGVTETGLATLPGEGAVADTIGTTLLAGSEAVAPTVTTTSSTAAPIFDYSAPATLTPAGNVVPATTLPTEFAAMDAEIARAGAEAAKNLPPSGLNQARVLANALTGGQQKMNMPNMQMPAFEQFGGLYRGNQMPFLTQQPVQQMPMQQTTNFLKDLAEQGQTNDLATLLRNI